MKTEIKLGLQSGIFFGALWVLLLSPGLIALGVMGYVLASVALAVLLFLLTAVPFGFAMGFFAAYQRKRFLAMQLVPADEMLLYQGGANHFVGFESVGGWLYLTDKALRFKSHEVNFQQHELMLPLSEITNAVPSCTAGVIPNGLLVHTNEGQSERFVVAGRRMWAAAIADAKSQAEQV